MELSDDDYRTLQQLEETLWNANTRFDVSCMENVFANDLIEFGRSGRIYTRSDLLREGNEPTNALLPLENLNIRLLSDDVAQVTYNSHVRYGELVESGRRSSIWSRTTGSWVLRFHQGTPFKPRV